MRWSLCSLTSLLSDNNWPRVHLTDVMTFSYQFYLMTDWRKILSIKFKCENWVHINIQIFYLWALIRFVWYQFPLEYHFFSPLHFQPLWHSYYPHSTSLYTRDYNLLNHKNCCCLNKFMSVVDIFDFVVFKFYHIAVKNVAEFNELRVG